MKNDFLLEILVEELPFSFVPSAREQMGTIFSALLEENQIKFGKVQTFATPRRLAILIEDVAQKCDDIIKDIKGPIKTAALDADGKYTNAALGFARKNGVEPDALYEKDGYIHAKVQKLGKTAKQVLEENIEKSILKFQGSHFMRWGYFEEKFSRPVENVVAILGDDILNVSVFGKKAVNKTKGHRFSDIKEVEIKDPGEYAALLKRANVYACPEERKNLIVELASKKAEEAGCTIDFSALQDLLEEITYITEYPVPVVCEFKKEYLEIPDIVTVTVMSKHQRYFPLYEKSGALSNKFITMANFAGTGEDSFENIKRGNQRVISARLEDGRFFYNEDVKTSLEYKLDELKGMTFQRGLGTLFDKTERIEELSSYIADNLNIQDKKDILRAARLSKADLPTKLVFEFTELQGFIGENYALKSGEKENVALAIKEHYFPLSANSALPSGIEGKIVSIADKIDTICAVFLSTQNEKKKKRPTGSNDPLGVRRAAIGILKIIISNNFNIDLYNLIEKSAKLISDRFQIKIEDETLPEIADFIYNRLTVLYDKTFNNFALLACKENKPMSNLAEWIKRVEAVCNFINKDGAVEILEAINRVIRITKNEKITGEVDSALFNTKEEDKLYQTYCLNKNLTYGDISKIKVFVEPLNAFFDKVLVMDKNPKIKANRLNLLGALALEFNSICDFSKIVIK